MKLDKTLITTLIIISLLQITQGQGPSVNMKPIIGVYTEPSDYSGYPADKYAYIAASYIKYIEMAGGQAVPIDYQSSQQYYDTIFGRINGIIFPGGGVGLQKGTPFYDNAAYLLKLTMKANDNGTYFPIWATCLGFEMMNIIIADQPETDVLTHVDKEEGIAHELKILQNGRILNAMPAFIYQISKVQPLYFYNHQWCVVPQTYKKYPKLAAFFNILATSTSLDNVEYIALIESKGYPIIASQFHAEKNNFEWKVQANHNLNAVMTSQFYADYFVDLARKNTHQFPDTKTEQAALIYNWNPVQLPSASFTQLYFFAKGDLEQQQMQQQQIENK